MIQALDRPTRIAHSWICCSETREKWLGMGYSVAGLAVATVKLEILGGTEEGECQSTDPGL